VEPTEEHVAVLAEEPRFWGAGEQITVKTALSVPAQILAGTYSLGIRMPDPEPTLHDDTRYSIRFANKDMWEEKTGTNIFLRVFEVVSSQEASNVMEFKETKP